MELKRPLYLRRGGVVFGGSMQKMAFEGELSQNNKGKRGEGRVKYFSKT